MSDAAAQESFVGGSETGQVGGDRQLLERFVARRDEAAFAELVRRHSGTVWSVCRRVLGREQDAEDAFQAAFLVLARKAAAIRKGEAVGSWLYAVAYRIATVARKKQARRMETEKQVSPSSGAASPSEESACRELQRLLDEELARLAEKYRAPFVLCCLQGLTRAEAADELGWKQGTVQGRLARARELLQKRLTRRGVALASILTASALAPATATAAPPALVAATTEATLAVLAGKSAALSPSALVLANTVLKGMTAVKLVSGLALVLTLTLGAVAALQLQPGADDPGPKPLLGLPMREAHTFQKTASPLVSPVDGRIATVALSPDGKRFVTAGGFPPLPGQLAIWATSGELLATVRPIPAVRSVAFAPDGLTVACGDFDGMVRVRDGFTGKELAAVKAHDSGVHAVAYSPDGQAIVSAGLDRLAKLWDAKTLQERGVFRGHTHGVTSVAFFKHGRGFVTGSKDGTAKVWDIASGAATQTLQIRGQVVIEAVAVARDDKTVATAHWDGAVRLWHAETGQEQAKLVSPGRAAMSMGISPDGKTLVAGLDEGSIYRWDLETQKPLPPLKRQHALAVRGLAFSSDSKKLWSGSDDRTARRYDLETGMSATTLRAGPGQSPATALAYAPDGSTFAMAMGDRIQLCDAKSGAVLHRLDGHTGKEPWMRVRSLAFAADGQMLASGGEDQNIFLWDTGTGKQRQKLTGHESAILALAFAPDGRLASGGQDGKIKIWDAATGREEATFKGHQTVIMAMTFTADSKSLASAAHDGVIKIWDLATGAERATLLGNVVVSTLAFAPDGTLASAGDDAVVRLWPPGRDRARDRAAPVILRGHRAPVLALAFSGGGRTLVTGDADGMIFVWDPRHGVARQVLPRDRLGITALAFHPQSEHLLSGNMVGAVSRWQGEPPPPPPPAELLPERFYQDFRGAKPPRVPLRIEGEGTHDVTTPDQSGLRMTLPAGWNHPGVWVRPHVPVSGDFDITAGYELLKIEHPDKGYGAGVVLLAVSPGSQKMAKLCRLLRPTEGDRYLADLTDHARNKITANTVPTQARRGQLRLVREGSTIRYLVADGKEQEFREIHRDEFGARDVEEFAFVVSTHGGLNAVDARLVDLRIRSGRFKAPPPIAVAGAAADAGKPIAAGDAVQNAAPQNEPDANQETDADAAGASRRSWLRAAVFLFILFALVGLVTSVIRRTRPRPVESAARMAEAASSAAAAALPVRFTCAGCGHVLTARPGQAGKTGKCPHCGQTVHLPANAPETKTAEARTGRRTTMRLAALGVLALLLGAGVLYLAMSPRIRPLSQPRNRPNLLNVPVGTETVPGVEESGFYNQEVDGRGRPFRWTDGKARLVIPLDRTKPPRALWLILQTTRPEEAAPVDLHVVANGKDLFSINTAGVWEKTLDLSDVNLGDELTLDITSSTFSPVDFPRFKISDARSLGVRINGMRLLEAAE